MMNYDEKYSRNVQGFAPAFPRQFRFLTRWMGASGRSLRILDLGGGTGEYSLAMQRLGHDVTLYELSAFGIAHARKLGVKKAIHGDFRSDMPRDRFDMVLVRGFSLLNTDDIAVFRRTLERIEVLLAPRGVLLYWSNTDLTGRWTASGWFYCQAATFRACFDDFMVFPALRYQAWLPVWVSRLVSRLVCTSSAAARPLTVAAYRRKGPAAP